MGGGLAFVIIKALNLNYRSLKKSAVLCAISTFFLNNVLHEENSSRNIKAG